MPAPQVTFDDAPATPAPAFTAVPNTELLPRTGVKEKTDLPSAFLAYPEGATVTYRTYNLAELDFFEQSSLTNLPYFDLILAGVDTSFDKEQLTLADLMYLGLLRRLASMGSTSVRLATNCPHCKAQNHTDLPTGELVFDDLKVPKLPIKLKLTIGEHTFMPLTISDYRKLAVLGLEEDTHAIIAIQCRTLEFPASIETIKNLTDQTDIRLVRKVDELLYHGVAEHPVTCSSCKKVYKVELDNNLQAFIYPFRRSEDDLADKISFG